MTQKVGLAPGFYKGSNMMALVSAIAVSQGNNEGGGKACVILGLDTFPPKFVAMETTSPVLNQGILKKVHHFALNVKDLAASRYFYGHILGLEELTGDNIPETLKTLVAQGKIANFRTPDGFILDLFWEPDLSPANADPTQTFTRAHHFAFDIAPEQFETALNVLKAHQIPIEHGPVTRPTGRGIYFYDPDGFIIEIRCDP